MKKKLLILALCISITIIISLSGCQEPLPNNGTDPRAQLPHLAYKGESLIYDISDVKLTFYCGSENAGDEIGSYKDYPLVTYIYFANEHTQSIKYHPNGELMVFNNNEISFQYADGYDPKHLYNTIEENQNFSICKKIFNADANSFYKNNTVTLSFKDTPYIQDKFAEEDLWGNGNALYKITQSYMHGIYVPNVSYELTIPSGMFMNDNGYLFFGVTSYFTEDYEASSGEIYTSAHLLEHRTIALYYSKEGSSISLSNYYNGGTNHA